MSRILSIAVLLLSIILPSWASAGNWRVIPIRLDFDRANRSGVVRLINSADKPLVLQVSASEWSQNDQGEDIYTPTEDLIFFPKVLSIPANEERILRAGLKIPAVDREKTYRLFIEEIPEPQSSASSTVNVAIRFGLPIFIAPIESKLRGEIAELEVKNGVFRGQVTNTGNVNFRPSSITLRGNDATGKETFSIPLKAWYLLAGVSRQYETPIPPEDCLKTSTILFEITDDNALNLNSRLEISSPLCTP